MARDRQRAQQRRTRQSGAAGSATGRPRAGRRVRDTGATPAPDPLDHASADLDEALLAEQGAIPPRARATDDAPPGADELYGADDGADEPRGATALAPRAQRREVGHRGRGGVGGFLTSSWDELRRVQWPDRRQVGQGTAVVLGFVVVAGGYLGLLDAIWKPLIEKIL